MDSSQAVDNAFENGVRVRHIEVSSTEGQSGTPSPDTSRADRNSRPAPGDREEFQAVDRELLKAKVRHEDGVRKAMRERP